MRPKTVPGAYETDVRRKKLPRRTLRKELEVATWNVQTLLQAGKLTNVISEMNRANIEILGIAEARWKGSGYFTTESGELVILL